MGNRLNILIASIFMLAISIWGVSYILTLRDTKVQLAIVGVILSLFCLLSIKPKYALDFKLLLFVVFGYFVAGKGFAYLSPKPPIYIGEIFFLIASAGVLLRSNLNLVAVVKINKLNLFVFIACIYGLLRLLLIDFQNYKMMALRDSAMIYYSFIALACSVIFQEEKYQRVFTKVLPYFIGLGFISYVFLNKIVNISGLQGLVKFIYKPHVDVAIPVTVAFAMGGFYFLGGRKRKGLGILCLLAAMYPIATDKTAFAFCFLLTSVILSFWGKMRQVLAVGLATGVIGLLASAILFSTDEATSSALMGTDVAETVQAVSSGNKGTTTGWRLAWWEIVFRDTYAQAPAFGLGLGSDITSNFMREYMNVSVPEEHFFSLTRYPHCILFTVFGRLGFVGLLFFLLYSFFFLKFCKSYSHEFIAPQKKELVDVILVAFVLAGFFNSMVQSTYENPYAGIPHWICLGVMMARYSVRKKGSEKLVIKNNTEAITI